MKRKLVMFLSLFLIGMGIAMAQTQVRGTVVDEDGESIIGATVQVKGTTQGTVTDLDGNFALSAPAGGTLVISYVGYATQEVAVSANPKVILITDSELLEEVMVVAYGTAKRSSFTGSAAVIDSEKISKRQVANVTNALSGQVAGVQVTRTNGQPGTTSTIRIRGIGSMAAGNSPLFVVDGVPFDGDISSINTADIESTTVLKDAASNALYGARGANGVILITTKSGKSREPKITVDVKWGSNRRGLSNYDVITDPALYLEKAYQAIYNGFLGTKDDNDVVRGPEESYQLANRYLPTNENGGVGYQIYTVPQGQSMIGMDGKLNPKATLGYSDGKFYYRPDNWYDELFKKDNLRQEYNVSVSGGSDKINYFASGGYLDDAGIVANSGFKRYSTRLNADYQAKEWLKLRANVSYTNYDMASPATQEGTSSANLFYVADYLAPIYPMYVRNADGTIKIDSRGYTVYDFGDRTGGNFNRTFMSGSNPASMIELDKRQYLADVFGGRWGLDIDLMEGLKFTYNLGTDFDNTRYSRLYNAFYGQYSRVGGIVYKGAYRTSSINHQQLLNYHKILNDVHSLDILLGHESYDYQYQYLMGSKEKLFNPEIVELDNAILNPTAESYTDNYATEGWLGRAQYEYDQKYIVSGSFRRDASSRFHPDNRWGNFGSVGAAWVMTQEDFMKDLDWVNFLKYKISYGIQGNDALLYNDGETNNYYPYSDQFTVKENNKDFATTMTYKGNKDITWETSYSFNTGFDFNLWNNKLSGGIEYFSRKTTDMLYYMPVPPSNGYATVPMNIGSVLNQGVEIDLRSDVFKTRDLVWNVFVNGTFLKNEIVELAPELNGELVSGSRIYKEGKSMYNLYIRNYAGVDENGVALYYKDTTDAHGNVIGQETTTEYNQATKYATGNILPTLYGGFGSSLNAHGFDFSVSFAYQLGGRMLDSNYQSLMHSGTTNNAGTNWHKDILNAWTAEQKDTKVPRLNAVDLYANSTSDRFLKSSDYLDLTNITLGYTLPGNLIQKTALGSLRVYLTADNVALWSARKGMDPRRSYTSSGGYRYSVIRTVSGGISIQF
ncbi:MAG: TonB-dependent receptor [Proteiniphilum sp.]|nr:TonB-dependent receptor [Proteiniphilum sp.]MDD4799575.1 TonB-dependent receptor [Proteiniphilum sp.]